jgi:hypothetical protein
MTLRTKFELFYLRHKYQFIFYGALAFLAIFLIIGTFGVLIYRFVNRYNKELTFTISQDLIKKYGNDSDKWKVFTTFKQDFKTYHSTQIDITKTNEGKVELYLPPNSLNKLQFFSLTDGNNNLISSLPFYYSTNFSGSKLNFDINTKYKSIALFNPYFLDLDDSSKYKIYNNLELSEEFLNYAKNHTTIETIKSEFYNKWLNAQVLRPEVANIIKEYLANTNNKTIPGFTASEKQYDGQFVLDSFGLADTNSKRNLTNQFGIDILNIEGKPKIVNRSSIDNKLKLIEASKYDNYKNNPASVPTFEIKNKLYPLNLVDNINNKLSELENLNVDNSFNQNINSYKLIPFLDTDSHLANLKRLVENAKKHQINEPTIDYQYATNCFDQSPACFETSLKLTNPLLKEYMLPQLAFPVNFVDYKSSSPSATYLSLFKNPYLVAGSLDYKPKFSNLFLNSVSMDVKYDGSYLASNQNPNGLTVSKNNLSFIININNIDPNLADLSCSMRTELIQVNNSTYYHKSIEEGKVNNTLYILKSGNDRFLKGDKTGSNNSSYFIKTPKEQANLYKNCFYDEQFGTNYLGRKINFKVITINGKDFTEDERIEIKKIATEAQFENR